jgi:hypothetical protein
MFFCFPLVFHSWSQDTVRQALNRMVQGKLPSTLLRDSERSRTVTVLSSTPHFVLPFGPALRPETQCRGKTSGSKEDSVSKEGSDPKGAKSKDRIRAGSPTGNLGIDQKNQQSPQEAFVSELGSTLTSSPAKGGMSKELSPREGY